MKYRKKISEDNNVVIQQMTMQKTQQQEKNTTIEWLDCFPFFMLFHTFAYLSIKLYDDILFFPLFFLLLNNNPIFLPFDVTCPAR